MDGREAARRELTSTALQTALNTAYFAESVATFAIVMGVAMLLSGIGVLVLTLRVLCEPARRVEVITKAPAPREAVNA